MRSNDAIARLVHGIKGSAFAIVCECVWMCVDVCGCVWMCVDVCAPSFSPPPLSPLSSAVTAAPSEEQYAARIGTSDAKSTLSARFVKNGSGRGRTKETQSKKEEKGKGSVRMRAGSKRVTARAEEQNKRSQSTFIVCMGE